MSVLKYGLHVCSAQKKIEFLYFKQFPVYTPASLVGLIFFNLFIYFLVLRVHSAQYVVKMSLFFCINSKGFYLYRTTTVYDIIIVQVVININAVALKLSTTMAVRPSNLRP